MFQQKSSKTTKLIWYHENNNIKTLLVNTIDSIEEW